MVVVCRSIPLSRRSSSDNIAFCCSERTPERVMDLVTHLTDRVLFAVPKKGRLHESCLELLLGADIQFHRHNRLDIALVKNHPLALVFLPAADIPRFVAEGNVHLGITGQDQVAEFKAHDDQAGEINEILELGFGKCSLQVQVPEMGPIGDARELIGKRVVTSFTGLTRAYFQRLERETGVKEGGTQIKYVGGSVEAACALGVADGIVDLVESGETMKAAGLKATNTVMETQAVLISSSTSGSLTPVSVGPDLQTLIANRIRGVIAAKRYVLLEYNVPRSLLAEVVKITPGKRAPTVSPLEGEDWVAVSTMVERKNLANVMDRLENKGASDILVFNIINSRA